MMKEPHNSQNPKKSVEASWNWNTLENVYHLKKKHEHFAGKFVMLLTLHCVNVHHKSRKNVSIDLLGTGNVRTAFVSKSQVCFFFCISTIFIKLMTFWQCFRLKIYDKLLHKRSNSRQQKQHQQKRKMKSYEKWRKRRK